MFNKTLVAAFGRKGWFLPTLELIGPEFAAVETRKEQWTIIFEPHNVYGVKNDQLWWFVSYLCEDYVNENIDLWSCGETFGSNERF